MLRPAGTVVPGFASLISRHPGVCGLSALGTTQTGIGEPFLQAILAEMFDPLAAHRLGLDVTADNARAWRA